MTGNLKENSWFCHERKILENCHDRPSHSDTTNTHHPARRQGDTTASRPSTGACPPHHTHNGAQPNSLTSARAAIACRQQPPRCPSLSRLSCSVTMCRVTILRFAVVLASARRAHTCTCTRPVFPDPEEFLRKNPSQREKELINK